jgi:hypothetical protein
MVEQSRCNIAGLGWGRLRVATFYSLRWTNHGNMKFDDADFTVKVHVNVNHYKKKEKVRCDVIGNGMFPVHLIFASDAIPRQNS